MSNRNSPSNKAGRVSRPRPSAPVIVSADGPRLIRSVQPKGLLSFGPTTEPLSLASLNLLIGPNGSGKSNFLEVIALLRSAASDFRSVIQRGGGVSEWIWKGRPNAAGSLDAVVENPGHMPVRYMASFRSEKQTFRLDDEALENERAFEGESKPFFYYQFRGGRPIIQKIKGEKRQLAPDAIDPNLPIMAQRRDPDTYPVLTQIGAQFERIRLYREWSFGRNTVFREPQRADGRNDRLEEDFSNLGLFLNRLVRSPATKKQLVGFLRDLYEGVSDFHVNVEAGTVQVYFLEGDFSIPATRLSDGSLRYLCLLAILCDPDPPPLIAIEEPELGLHPDLLPKVADLLRAASLRTQLIVTTHSDSIVSAFTDKPEVVVVCEKHEGATKMERLEADRLAGWLDKYRLGDLWSRGEIGGNRW